ncbi:MAG: prolipoprotein diacylglyceryl transferase [Anaeromyxobacteraceae bacterium]
MLPVLFTLTIPAALGKALACAVAVAVVLGRAHAYRRAPGEGTPSWGAALRDDRLTIGAVALALAALWRAGALDGPLLLPLHTYGVMIATGFVVAIALAQREARRRGQDAHAVSDLAFWIIVAALAGSRLYYIAVNAGEYVGPGAWVVAHGVRIPRVLALWEGGLVFYGGFIGATLTAWWFMRRQRMAFLPYADTIIPSLAVGHFFGRLGCFAAGCCWGSVSHAHLPWLAKFPPESLAYQTFARRADAASFLAADRLTTLPVHPTQLYESFGELALFALLVLVVRPRRRFDGQVLATWLMAYAVLRGVVELFRGDVERGVFGGLGVGQWTSVAILAAGAAVWAVGRRGASRGDGAGPALAA